MKSIIRSALFLAITLLTLTGCLGKEREQEEPTFQFRAQKSAWMATQIRMTAPGGWLHEFYIRKDAFDFEGIDYSVVASYCPSLVEPEYPQWEQECVKLLNSGKDIERRAMFVYIADKLKLSRRDYKRCPRNETRHKSCFVRTIKGHVAQICDGSLWLDIGKCELGDRVCNDGDKRRVRGDCPPDHHMGQTCVDGKWTDEQCVTNSCTVDVALQQTSPKRLAKINELLARRAMRYPGHLVTYAVQVKHSHPENCVLRAHVQTNTAYLSGHPGCPSSYLDPTSNPDALLSAAEQIPVLLSESWVPGLAASIQSDMVDGQCTFVADLGSLDL